MYTGSGQKKSLKFTLGIKKYQCDRMGSTTIRYQSNQSINFFASILLESFSFIFFTYCQVQMPISLFN